MLFHSEVAASTDAAWGKGSVRVSNTSVTRGCSLRVLEMELQLIGLGVNEEEWPSCYDAWATHKMESFSNVLNTRIFLPRGGIMST
jgi:hypothetical protein